MGNAEEICKSVLLLTSPETMRGFQSLFMFSPRVQRKQSVREKAIGTDRDVVINPAERLCHTGDYVRGSRLVGQRRMTEDQKPCPGISESRCGTTGFVNEGDEGVRNDDLSGQDGRERT